MVSKQHGTLHYNASEITAMASGTGPSSGIIPVGGIIMCGQVLLLRDPGCIGDSCDGDAGTPDLQSKFVKGAAAGQNPGATGGGSTYSHSSCSVAAHSNLSHSGGAVSRGIAGVTLDQHAALTHAGSAVGAMQLTFTRAQQTTPQYRLSKARLLETLLPQTLTQTLETQQQL